MSDLTRYYMNINPDSLCLGWVYKNPPNTQNDTQAVYCNNEMDFMGGGELLAAKDLVEITAVEYRLVFDCEDPDTQTAATDQLLRKYLPLHS